MQEKKNREEKTDNNLYDAQESDQYVQGYALAIKVTMQPVRFLDVQLLIHDKELNVYAYIPTDIPVSDKEAGVLCYILFRTEFEYIAGKYKINLKKRGKETGNHGYNIPTGEPDHQPVWFHKSWILPSYDPTMYDTDAKKYDRIKHRQELAKIFPDKVRLEYRRAACRRQKCYEPVSEKNPYCKNYHKDLANDKICYFCAASERGRNCLTSHG